MKQIGFLVGGLMSGLLLPASCQAPAYQRDYLKGLKAVVVTVDPVVANGVADAPRQDHLQVEVELRLRKAGIPIVALDHAKGRSDLGFLEVGVSVSPLADGGPCGFEVNVSLDEPATLVRDPSRRVIAATWRSNILGAVGAGNLDKITDRVADQVDFFANDFLAANARTTTRRPARPGQRNTYPPQRIVRQHEHIYH